MVLQFETEVLQITDVTDEDTCRFKIVSLKRPDGFAFAAGQFVMLAMDSFRLWGNPEQMKWTAMSIASAPEMTDRLEFCISVKETPGFSRHIADTLKAGDRMFVKGPYGNFVVAPQAEESVFVAAGSGIAPIIGMIRTLMSNGYRKPVALFFGFRTGNQFLYKQELEGYAKRKNFMLQTTISRDDPGWRGQRGYVQSLLTGLQFQKPAHTHAYICGNPEMVAEVRKLFMEKGLAEERIHREQW